MLLLKIGIVLGSEKYEKVFNLSVLLEHIPSWLVRPTPLLARRRS